MNAGRGSRPGFSSSARMSVTVGRPNVSSTNSAGSQRAQHGRVADQRRHVGAGRGQDPPHHRVRLGVHAGGVERVVAAADAQEAGALLERLRAEPRHLLAAPCGCGTGRCSSRCATMFSASALADAGDPGQQRRRGGVDVDADRVHAVLDDRVERAGQLDLGQVVLVLADADRLRVDLDQLGQRVLQPAGDGDRAAQRDVQAGQLLPRRRRRRSRPTRRPRRPRPWSA